MKTIAYENRYTVYDKIKVSQDLFSLREELYEAGSPKIINLKNKLLTANEVDILIKILEEFEQIEELYLGNNAIGDVGILPLSGYLKENNSLKLLNLQNTEITDEGVKELSEALMHNTTLETLDLYHNKISEKGAKYLAQSLMANAQLENLNLRYNHINDGGVIALSDLIRNNLKLKKIFLGANGITKDGIKSLCYSFENNLTLKHIDLGTNILSHIEVELLAKTLNGHPSLEFLNLERNYLGSKGAKLLAPLLRNNKSLKGLNVRYAYINTIGLEDFFDLLGDSITLESIYLGGNLACQSGTKVIASYLVDNHTIKVLDLENNSIWIEGAPFVAQIINENQNLEELRLQNNGFRDEGATIISDAIRNNIHLKKINLENNSISDQGLRSISDAVSHNNTLIECNISNNSFGFIVKDAVNKIEKKVECNSKKSNISSQYKEDIYRTIQEISEQARKDLFAKWNNGFEWKNFEKLSENGRSNLVLRGNLIPNQPTLPGSIIIKKALQEDGAHLDSCRFLNEWTGLEFLSSLSPLKGYTPLFYGANIRDRFLMFEDMGKLHVSLVNYLSSGVYQTKLWDVFLKFSELLANIHSATVGKQEQYTKLLSANAESINNTSTYSFYDIDKIENGLVRNIEGLISLPNGFQQELREVLTEIADQKYFIGYIHGDVCPDSIFIKEDNLYVFDFEFGHFGHIFLDLASIRMHFPCCWCSRRLPEKLICEFEKTYRDKITKYYPNATENNVFYYHLTLCCAYWLFDTLNTRLPQALDNNKQWGISSIRQRIVTQLESFIFIANKTGQLPSIKCMATLLLERLKNIWHNFAPLPFYPTFCTKAFEKMLSDVKVNHF